MTIIRNKFRTKCAGTLRLILPGELILLNSGKAYSIHSKEYQQFKQDQEIKARSIKIILKLKKLHNLSAISTEDILSHFKTYKLQSNINILKL